MTCQNEDCKNETKEGYKYCYDCYKKWQDQQPDKNSWDDDPMVDVLLKINSNLGKIGQSLEALNERDERRV